jgi:hypothetical protein
MVKGRGIGRERDVGGDIVIEREGERWGDG